MQDRLNEIKKLKKAHDEYIEVRTLVAKICRENPHGLLIKPLYGQPGLQLVALPSHRKTETGSDSRPVTPLF